jgi:hypothetical protein
MEMWEALQFAQLGVAVMLGPFMQLSNFAKSRSSTSVSLPSRLAAVQPADTGPAVKHL